MKIGLETESYHLFLQNGLMDIFDFIDKAYSLGLDGVQINIVKKERGGEWGALDNINPNYLKKVKNKLQKYNFFCELDTNSTDPSHLETVIEIADILGADVIRTFISVNQNIEKSFDQAIRDIKIVVSKFEEKGIKLAIENHEYETSNEIIQIIKKINSDYVGVLCDTGNSMMAWENPVDAVNNLAPYTFSTHFKDHIVIEDGNKHRVCGVPLGKGNINLKECFKILANKSPISRINVEMCNPYTSSFKRKPGTGGVYELGEGAFVIEKKPYDSKFIKPIDYYYPNHLQLQKLLNDQEKGVYQSIEHIFKLKNNYNNSI